MGVHRLSRRCACTRCARMRPSVKVLQACTCSNDMSRMPLPKVCAPWIVGCPLGTLDFWLPLGLQAACPVRMQPHRFPFHGLGLHSLKLCIRSGITPATCKFAAAGTRSEGGLGSTRAPHFLFRGRCAPWRRLVCVRAYAADANAAK